MGCQLVLFSLLLLCSALADSFPYPEANIHGEFLPGFRQSSLHVQPQLNVNPLLQVSPEIKLGLPNPNIQTSNFKNINRFILNKDNTLLPIRQQYKNYDNIAATANLQNALNANVLNAHLRLQHQTPTALAANNAWWSPGLHQPQHQLHFGKPHETNNLVQSYVKSYANQGSYDPKSSNFQLTGLTSKPLVSLDSYNHGWLPQHQHNKIITAVSPVEYLPWPIPDDQKLHPITSLPNVFKIPFQNKENEDIAIIKPMSLQLDSQAPITASQQTLNDQTTASKHYIIVHMNGTHEHVYNLDNIVMDSSNIAHIKSDDALNQVHAIIEVEESNETDQEIALEFPYDTGITKIPRDTDSNRNVDPKTLKNPFIQKTPEVTYDMNYFKSEYIMPIQSTPENLHGGTTDSSVQIKTTNDNPDSGKNSFSMYATTKNTINATDIDVDNSINEVNDSGIIDSDSDNTTHRTTNSAIITNATNNVIDITTDDTSYQTTTNSNDEKQDNVFATKTPEIPERAQICHEFYDYEDNEYYNEVTKYNTLNTITQTSQQTSTYDKNIEEISFDDYDTTQSRNLSKRTENKRDFGYNKPVQKDLIELDITPLGKSKQPAASVIIYEEVDPENENCPDENNNVPAAQEPSKLREDLKVDASDLKTVVDKPVVWFRPDEQFWDKVTKGKQGFDQISFYDVHCKPRLVERVTTINHYENGTEIVDYVETIWDSTDDKNPREIRSKREFREPEY